MRVRLLASIIAMMMVVGAALATAQSDSAVRAARTPAECLASVNAWRINATAAARAQGKTVDPVQILRDAQGLGRRCAARFPIDKLDPTQIGPFADLSVMSGDTVGARAAIARGTSAPGLNQRQRGELMLTAERLAMLGVDPFIGIIAAAEAIVTRIDSLADSLAVLKINAHQRLFSQL
jgi:hypothetical protein